MSAPLLSVAIITHNEEQNLPAVLNLFHSESFVFDNPCKFPEREGAAVRLAQIFFVAMTIYSQTYRLGLASSRRLDATTVMAVTARSRKSCNTLIGWEAK